MSPLTSDVIGKKYPEKKILQASPMLYQLLMSVMGTYSYTTAKIILYFNPLLQLCIGTILNLL